jgi:hypothetical protein
MRDIPYHSDGTERGSYSTKQRFIKKIGGDNLENGFDSMQIRIWTYYKDIDSLNLYVIKNTSGNWSATVYEAHYNYSFERNEESIILKDSEGVSKTPKSGWKDFLQSLFELEIARLPDATKVRGTEGITDGNTFFIEVATNNSYRFYEYPDPFLVQDSIPETNKMKLILNLIEDEL